MGVTDDAVTQGLSLRTKERGWFLFVVRRGVEEGAASRRVLGAAVAEQQEEHQGQRVLLLLVVQPARCQCREPCWCRGSGTGRVMEM